MNRRPRRVFQTLALLTGLVALPSPAMAHGGAGAWIHVPAEKIARGGSVELRGMDLTPNAKVTVEITALERTYSVGQVLADADGHFAISLGLPAEVPEGYAQLRAISEDGTEASTWVLVGPGTTAAAPPPATGTGASWMDPSVLVLLVFVIGALAIVARVCSFQGRIPLRRRSARGRRRANDDREPLAPAADTPP